jgi:hypothetical protein
MATLSHSESEKVRELYNAGMSMRAVAESLSTSIDVVTYTLRKLGVKRRSAQAANAIVYANRPASFSIKNKRNKELETAGAMLYLAEGHKTDRASGIDLANSDPRIARLFITMLRSRYVLDEKRFRVLLYCHGDQHIPSLIAFWSNILNIPHSQFTKPYIKLQTQPGKRVMPHGMVHIRYSDKKLLNDIRNLIDSYVQKFEV